MITITILSVLAITILFSLAYSCFKRVDDVEGVTIQLCGTNYRRKDRRR